MRELFIFRDHSLEDSSGDIVFESLAGLKRYMLEELDLDGLWVHVADNSAEEELREWDGSEDIELMNDSYEAIYAAGKIEVRP